MARNGANPVHGFNRRPVGDSRTAVPAEATVRRAGTALARYALGASWRALDSAHRCTMARIAVEVSALSDLSSAFPILAAFRAADLRAAKTGRGLTRPRQDRFVGNLHRCQLQFGEKGALLSVQLAAAKAAKSWRSQTAMVFLSPAASPALRRMKPNSSKPPSRSVSHEPSQNE